MTYFGNINYSKIKSSCNIHGPQNNSSTSANDVIPFTDAIDSSISHNSYSSLVNSDGSVTLPSTSNYFYYLEAQPMMYNNTTGDNWIVYQWHDGSNWVGNKAKIGATLNYLVGQSGDPDNVVCDEAARYIIQPSSNVTLSLKVVASSSNSLSTYDGSNSNITNSRLLIWRYEI